MEPGDGSRRLTIPFESHLAGHAIGLWPLTSFVQPSQTVLMNAKFALWFLLLHPGIFSGIRPEPLRRMHQDRSGRVEGLP